MSARPSLFLPVDSSGKEIRLIELLPASRIEAITIHLCTVQLFKTPEYEALSYVWGTEICPLDASVNGESFPITSNLDTALRYLRFENRPRKLWIDAICIDQSNKEERGEQVQMMRDIYESATNVIVWLGPADEGEDFNQYMDYMKRNVIPKNLGKSFLETVEALCTRPWFGRVWVVQELALAKRPTIQIGHHTLPWSSFYGYIWRIHPNRAHPDEQEGQSWPIDPKGGGPWFLTAPDRVAQLHRIRQQRNTLDLYRAMHLTMNLESTDPVDKVYGMLGVSNKSKQGTAVVVDYNKPIARLYAEVTATLIRHYFSIAYAVRPMYSPQSESRIQGLPSWALDLRLNGEITGQMMHGNWYHCPSPWVAGAEKLDPLITSLRGFAPVASLSSDYKALSTVGVHIGTIAVTSAKYLDELQTYTTTAFNSPPRTRFSLSSHSLYKFYQKYGEPRGILPTAMYRAMLGFNAKSEEIESEAKEDENETEKAYWHSIQPTVQGRIMFLTEEGILGHVYHPDQVNGVQCGDMVVGLFGLDFPCILRRVENSPKYEMINVADVAGHTVGHKFIKDVDENTKWTDFAEYGMKEYVII